MNSNDIRVTPENFEKAVKMLFEKYGDFAYEVAEQATKVAARETAKELKVESPVGAEGSYARGWSHKAQKNGVTKYSETVYNRTDYQLTHLLEKEHDTGRGGHYPATKDHTGIIKQIEDKQTQKFMEEVIRKL